MGCAHYESRSRRDEKATLIAPGAAHHEGEVQVFEARGIHPIVWLEGNQLIHCGGVGRGIGVEYRFPDCAALRDELPPAGPARTDFAVADTSIIEQVSFDSPGLTWYRVDANRGEIVVAPPASASVPH